MDLGAAFEERDLKLAEFTDQRLERCCGIARGKQGIEPRECDLGIVIGSSEPLGDPLCRHGRARGAGEGRGRLARDPGQQIATLVGVPAPH